MRTSLTFLLLALPALSLGAQMQAGFPALPIWASKSTAVEGEGIVISTVILNGGPEALHATLVFTADDTRIGAREFELPAGESQIHSIEWKSVRGEHRMSAKIEGTSVPLSQSETPSIMVSISEPPPPSAVAQSISFAAKTAGSIASSSAPIVLDIAKSVFDAIEPYRKQGIERLDKYLSHSKKPIGTVAGTSTSDAEGFSETPKTNKNLLSDITRAAAEAARVVLSSLYLFYPLLALTLFGGLYALARRIKRRSFS